MSSVNDSAMSQKSVMESDLQFDFSNPKTAHDYVIVVEGVKFYVNSGLYLHRRFRMPNVIRAFSQFGVLLLSLFICLSRVRDFRHRYVDVAGGGMLGITVGMGMIHFVLFNFRHHRYHDHSEDSCDSSADEQKRSLLRSQYGIIIDA